MVQTIQQLCVVRRYRGVICVLLLLGGCSRKEKVRTDHPRLTPNVRMQDVIFHSGFLNRDMPYRVILPSAISAEEKLPVVYLLHGNGGNYQDWSNYSDVAKYAESGLILVMPEGGSSYYTNAANRLQDRYEDYIVKDLISDVENRFPAKPDRSKRATRPFSIRRWGQWRSHRAIFGAWGGDAEHRNDPFVLARTVDPKRLPYLFLTCGEQEGLLPSNRQFARLLAARHFQFEFEFGPGSHDWNQWNSRLPGTFSQSDGAHQCAEIILQIISALRPEFLLGRPIHLPT